MIHSRHDKNMGKKCKAFSGFKHIMLKAHCHETWKAQTWALFVPFYHSTVTSAVKMRYAVKNAVQPRA